MCEYPRKKTHQSAAENQAALRKQARDRKQLEAAPDPARHGLPSCKRAIGALFFRDNQNETKPLGRFPVLIQTQVEHWPQSETRGSHTRLATPPQVLKWEHQQNGWCPFNSPCHRKDTTPMYYIYIYTVYMCIYIYSVCIPYIYIYVYVYIYIYICVCVCARVCVRVCPPFNDMNRATRTISIIWIQLTQHATLEPPDGPPRATVVEGALISPSFLTFTWKQCSPGTRHSRKDPSSFWSRTDGMWCLV